MEGGERTWRVLEIGKKDAVRGNFNRFHLCFTNETRGDRHTLHTCKMEGVWADRRLSMVGGGGGEALENEKKRLSEEILTSFNYVLLMKLGGIDTLYMQNGRGWADRCVSMVGGSGSEGALPPPP